MNKKIRNATVNNYNNIQFKSKLEKLIYNILTEKGFNPKYEFKTYLLWEGFTPVTPLYDKESDSQHKKRQQLLNIKDPKVLTLKNTKIIGIRYTPDFYFKYNNLHIYIEAKGKENDVFYIKKKMFVKYLDNLNKNQGIKSLFFIIYTKKQLLQAIEIIKEYEQKSG